MPRPPGWWRRTWVPLTEPAGRPAVAGVAVVALLGAWVLRLDRGGVDWLIVAGALAVVSVVIRRRDRAEPQPGRPARVGWAVAALALVAVGTVRADGLLDTWCLLAALACGSVALSGGRTMRGLAAGSIAFLVGAARAMPWWGRGSRRFGTGGARIGRIVLVSAVLVLVFGSLFASADPEFGHLLWRATPSLHPGEFGRAIVGLLVAVVLALGFGYLAAGRPVFDAVAPGPARSVRRSEWAVPLAVLDGLFAAFVAVQLATLFGGRARVLRTAGLTYAQYARSGFWQLLVVAGLTLVVIGVAVRVAGRTAPADRALLRILLGALATLTLVIVASALQRLSVYDDAYGFTRLRLAVGVTEMWFGLVFVLVLVAGLRLRAPWLPRLAAATAVLALLVLAGIGPDRFIAQHNVDRYDRTGRIDVAYLASLSADAVPPLERLPPQVRDCLLADIQQRLDGHPDDWRSWNLGRERARTLLGPDRTGGC